MKINTVVPKANSALLKKVGQIILASASPRREQLLKEAGFFFKVVPSDLSEPEHTFLTPSELCKMHAFRKADAVADKYPDSLVIGADTVVCLGSKIFGKPSNLDEARRFLKELSGKTHTVITGVCLMHKLKNISKLFSTTTLVTFHTLDDNRINEYISRVNVLDKAGAYGIQENGDLIVKSIRGSYTNVVGLPMERLIKELKALKL